MAKTRSTKRARSATSIKAIAPSAALAEVVGSKPIPRSEVTKKLWAYIKKNGLQDAKNKRLIKADRALRPVFGGKATVSKFEMTKLVDKHLGSEREDTLRNGDELDPGLAALAHLYSKL